MLNLLIEPLKFEFMRNAIAVGVLLGILCAVVGSYLIVQQMGMMVDMIAHSVLAGLPVAFSLGFNISIGAFISGIISAVIMAWIQSQSRLKIDAVMALILSTFLAISITLISLLRTTKLDLDGFLFGNILSVAPTDVQQTFVITLIILATVKLFYKELLFYTFDPLGSASLRFACKLDLFGDDFGDYADDCCEFANCGGAVSNFAINRAGNDGVFVGKRATFNDGIRSHYWDYS
jgi:manganese/iron transport system permease protein